MGEGTSHDCRKSRTPWPRANVLRSITPAAPSQTFALDAYIEQKTLSLLDRHLLILAEVERITSWRVACGPGREQRQDPTVSPEGDFVAVKCARVTARVKRRHGNPVKLCVRFAQQGVTLSIGMMSTLNAVNYQSVCESHPIRRASIGTIPVSCVSSQC